LSSINVRGSIRFRQPGRRSDCWRSPSCLPAARLPEHQHLQPDLRTGKHFLGRCARPRTRKVPDAEHPLYFGVSPGAEPQERAISVPRLILIPRPPTAPALARSDKIERNRSLSRPLSVPSSTYGKACFHFTCSDGNKQEGVLLLGWAAACSPARLPKLGSCSRESRVKIVT
jgi:hypothetical protein